MIPELYVQSTRRIPKVQVEGRAEPNLSITRFVSEFVVILDQINTTHVFERLENQTSLISGEWKGREYSGESCPG